MKRIDEKIQKEILIEYKSLKSLSKLAKKFSMLRSTIFRILKSNNVNMKNSKIGKKLS